ncbi:MAG: response regulator [Vicinamibacterales bacterium]
MSPILLLADHSLTIRRVMELTFADAGIRVVTVADGREAIEQIQREPPDIVLADVGMPEPDGYAVASFVKQTPSLSHIPVLLLAGALEPVDDDQARRSGADGVLVKPFEPQVAVARVRELLAQRPGATAAPTQDSAAPVAGGGDYLDRLDAAFAAMSTSPRPIGQPAGEGDDAPERKPPVPSPSAIARPHTPVPSPSAIMRPETPVPSPSAIVRPAPPVEAATPSFSLSDAFVALLAAEQGRPLPNGPVLPAPVIADAQVDEIARRVATRLGDEPMRQAVLDAAERLVREEIDRIKGVQRGS